MISNNNFSIAVDAMGGDNSPNKVIEGCEIFLESNINTKLIIFGDQNLIKNKIKKKYFNNFMIIHCSEKILDNDKPSSVLRSKKDSSMRKALEYLKDNPNVGFVSSGNTGAMMALSKILLGTLNNIERPAICSMIPTTNNFCVMLDLGANKDCNEKHILQFSIMGDAFAKINNIQNPKIAILNIGTEEIKGKEYLQDGANLINDSFLKDNFIGFIEPDDITTGKADVIVTDGFTGNIALKSAEGISKFMTTNFQNIFTKSILNNIAYLILKKDLSKFSKKMNPSNYNGAIFLGINGIVIKSHGSANAKAFSQALNNCLDFLKGNVNNLIIQEFKLVNFINE
tara:strand:+ start:2733 stop:3755 length:1023 start_codon:yes stop_codon:yes gene_type:complete